MAFIEWTEQEKIAVFDGITKLAEVNTRLTVVENMLKALIGIDIKLAVIEQYIKSRTGLTRFIVPTLISLVSVTCCIYVTFIKP